ncbi:hypothetical protein [Alteromonas sp. ASW11-130]|uniref:hypothetical protein n=1 Tax=Alteromonas sp. ASW11-130 TaxID=3015775 RepID=UPI00224281DD|nr:hypothetical protein [Alteromonas sp. ASW11-130]MCW8092732.1 hypothetical protein [Alteromonas sp. ASW11-130]
MFRILKHKLVASKFKRHGLGIIEDIAAENFTRIVEYHKSRGWEFCGSPNQFNWSKTWTVKLRKGTSELKLTWQPQFQGNIIGIKRILNGVASHFGLHVLDCPTHR